MLSIWDKKTGVTTDFNSIQEVCSLYEEFTCEANSGSKTHEELESELIGGTIVRAIVESVIDCGVESGRFIVTQTDIEASEGEAVERDESYLLLRLSEEDVIQVLYFYGFHDLEVSIEGDPTVTFVDGHELSDLMGGCHVKITGWLSWTKDYHEKQEEVLRAAISQSIQDIANAKKGRVNHFAFL